MCSTFKVINSSNRHAVVKIGIVLLFLFYSFRVIVFLTLKLPYPIYTMFVFDKMLFDPFFFAIVK
jgi:hypothetical protein